MNKNEQYDVCVVGSGPGGSTAATFIAMRGHKVLLVEKESLPVYKVGESLLPATIHGICNMLGVAEELERENFVRKQGGTFRWGKNKEPWTFAFAGSDRFHGPTSYAYQVERIKFDAILLNNARRKGVEVRERHRVENLVIEDGRVAGLNLIDDAGTESVVRSKYVVDASGHSSTIARHAGQRVFSKFFQNIAVFGYFVNAGRLPVPNSGNIFCVAFEKGWFWYIPLSNNLTSIGAVIGQEYSSILHQRHDLALDELISSCEPIRSLLAGAARSSDHPYNEVRVRKDYSYCNRSFWAPGLALVGDAACFVDPVFSSGVHLATYSALLAARSINATLGGHLEESAAFAEFEARYRREYKYFYDFLTAFYELDQDMEGYFWSARTLMKDEEVGEHAFLNLVGGDASGELKYNKECKADRRSKLAEVLFPAAKGTPAEEGGLVNGQAAFWEELTAEGTQLQVRGLLKHPCPPERPLIPNGLVPSQDGLHWVKAKTPARKHASVG